MVSGQIPRAFDLITEKVMWPAYLFDCPVQDL